MPYEVPTIKSRVYTLDAKHPRYGSDRQRPLLRTGCIFRLGPIIQCSSSGVYDAILSDSPQLKAKRDAINGQTYVKVRLFWMDF